MFSVSSKLEEQLTNVRFGLDENEQHGLGRQDRYDHQSSGVLEHAGDEMSALRYETRGFSSSSSVYHSSPKPGLRPETINFSNCGLVIGKRWT